MFAGRDWIGSACHKSEARFCCTYVTNGRSLFTGLFTLAISSFSFGAAEDRAPSPA